MDSRGQAVLACSSGLKPGCFFMIVIGTSGTRALPRLFAGGVVSLASKVNSRFLTGPSALFGMTRVVGRGVGLFVALEALLHPGALRGA